MTEKSKTKKKIVIVGTGFGGTYTLKHLHNEFCGREEVDISIIGDKNYFLFTPLLHEVATGGVHISNVTEPIRKVLGCCLDNFHLGKAEEINTKECYVRVAGKNVSYDYLVLAPGSVTNFFNIKGAEENAFALKTLPDAIKIKNHCITQMEKASQVADDEKRRNMLRFVIVGGGPTGVELAGELLEFIRDTFAYYYARKLMDDISIVLVHRGKELLPQFGPKLREKSLKILKSKGIDVRLDVVVTEISQDALALSTGEKIMTENIFWTAGTKPQEINFDTEIRKINDGRILVNEYLQVNDHPEIFALGDICAFDTGGGVYAPALAQIAVRQSKQVAKNIRLLSENKKPERYNFQYIGSLISLGQWSALGEVHHLSFGGKFTWWIWRSVYLFKVISWRKRLIIAVDWTINLFFPRDISQI